MATTLTYRPRGWLKTRTVAAETTGYDYDNSGNLAKVTLPDDTWRHYRDYAAQFACQCYAAI